MRRAPRSAEMVELRGVAAEDRGAIRHVVLNRPEKRNAMSQALLVELGDALRAAGDDASVHCVVLRGEGAVFSAGVDLGELASFAGDTSVLRPLRNVCDSPNMRRRRARGRARLRPADRLR